MLHETGDILRTVLATRQPNIVGLIVTESTFKCMTVCQCFFLITLEVVSTNRPNQAPLAGPFNDSAVPIGCNMYLYLYGRKNLVLTTSISPLIMASPAALYTDQIAENGEMFPINDHSICQ